MRSKHTNLANFIVFDVDCLRCFRFFQKVAKKNEKLIKSNYKLNSLIRINKIINLLQSIIEQKKKYKNGEHLYIEKQKSKIKII